MPTKLIDGGLGQLHAPITIGLDQSLTGFALTAMHTLEPKKHLTWVYKSPYKNIERLVDIRQWLTDNLTYLDDKFTISDIAMEGTVLLSQSALILGELSATVRLAIYDYFDEGDHRRYPLRVPPLTLKRFATGKGNSKKQEMLLQIYKRWGVEFTDDNAADAYALARLVSGFTINKIEEDVVKQMSEDKYRDYSPL